MELTAAIEALKTCTDGEKVELFTDSEYLRRGITEWMDAWIRNGWTRRKGQPVLNKDLWLELHEQNTRLQVDWRWVKAHAGHTFNELVDQAARDAAMSASKTHDASTITEERTTTTAATPSSNVNFYISATTIGESHSAWAIVREKEGNIDISQGIQYRMSANRCLLTGVIELMRSIPEKEAVSVTTDTEYLFKGVTQWLEGWRRRGWRKSDDKPIANKDLWMQIHGLLGRVHIDWQLERRSDENSPASLMHAAALAARDAQELSRP